MKSKSLVLHSPGSVRRRDTPGRIGWWRFLTRWRLGALDVEIERLEQAMAEEFATTAMRPVLTEHARLCGRRDGLQRRLAWTG